MFPRKYRIHAILIISVLAIIIAPQITKRPDKNKVDATVAAAQEFLQLVDAGRYADSWLIADPYLQQTLPVLDWEEKLSKIREPLGSLDSRELEDASFTAAAEELPDSEFVLLEYRSQFSQKQVDEAITVVLGRDNRWRVVGYFIQ